MKCYYKYYRNIVYTVKNTTIYTNINAQILNIASIFFPPYFHSQRMKILLNVRNAKEN